MEILFPAALALAILALPIIALYMLRLRRREQYVSSTLLWRELVLDRAANAPWQRLRRNLLLILQLLILAALVFALMRPVMQSADRIEGNVIVILDASASMSATDGKSGGSRFDDALAEVSTLVGALGSNDQMTIIAAGRNPRIVAAATNDSALLHNSLEALVQESGTADWPAAFALASGLTQGATDPLVVVVSDGGLPDGLPALPAEVTFIPIGQNGDNLAISAVGLRPRGEELSALVSVTNYGPSLARARVGLYLDGTLFDARELEVESGDTAAISWPLPATAEMVEARLEAIAGSTDNLPLDNRAWQLREETGRQIRYHSEGNLFLERFFSVLPGYDFAHVAGSDEPDDSDPSLTAGFSVFDGVPLPESLPSGNILIVNPQAADTSMLPIAIAQTGVFTQTQAIRQADSPLLTDVDWRNVHIARAQQVNAPGLEPLIEAEGGPLLLAGEVDGRRIVIIPFDLQQSDLPLQIAFPILMANITAWLSPERAMVSGGVLEPNTAIQLLPDERAFSIAVTSPDGDVWEQEVSNDLSSIRFDATDRTGVYTVSARDENGESIRESHFVVNFIDAEESRIQPQRSIFIGQAEASSRELQNAGQRELWPLMLWAGLLLLMLEWWVAYRRRSGRQLTRS